jgi:hypothetical protein
MISLYVSICIAFNKHRSLILEMILEQLQKYIILISISLSPVFDKETFNEWFLCTCISALRLTENSDTPKFTLF